MNVDLPKYRQFPVPFYLLKLSAVHSHFAIQYRHWSLISFLMFWGHLQQLILQFQQPLEEAACAAQWLMISAFLQSWEDSNRHALRHGRWSEAEKQDVWQFLQDRLSRYAEPNSVPWIEDGHDWTIFWGLGYLERVWWWPKTFKHCHFPRKLG